MQWRPIFCSAVIAAALATLPVAGAQSVAPAIPAEVGISERAADRVEEPVETISAAPVEATSIEHVDMVIEGAVTSVRSQTCPETAPLYDLSDIAPALRSSTELDATVLKYLRFQDAVIMSVDMADGKVRSNEIVLGKLPDFESREAADHWVDLNTVSVLTGTHASTDDQGRTVLTLDKQLKPQFGLELWVNGAFVDTFGQEPRTIGPILLLPLESVTTALGHQLQDDGATIRVRRTEDQAEISLEFATGLVSVNGTPRGITGNMQFSERDPLLLPFSAVETLTGTHVRLVPGTNRVEVNLDNRLTSTALPGERIDDEAGETPFTPEALSYELSDRGPLKANFSSHWGNYNSVARYESAGGLEQTAGFQPSWLSLDVQSLDGWTGTIGDYSASYRELSGAGQTRVRGLSWRKQRQNGTIMAIAAGVPLNGIETINEQVSVPKFGGFAGGARLISADQSQDIGISASVEPDGETGLVVIGGQKRFDFRDNDRGLQSAYVAADLGSFSGEEAGVDLRARASATYAATSQIGLSANASYDGEKFASGAGQNSFAGVFDQRIGARTAASGSATWRSVEPWGILNQVSAGLRVSMSQQDGDTKTTNQSTSAQLNTRIGTSGPSVSATLTRNASDEAGTSSESTDLRVRALQRFDWGQVSASYVHAERSDSEATQQLVANVQAYPVQKTFENGVSLAIAPTLTMTANDETSNVGGGASIFGNIGQALGERFAMTGRLSALSDFDAAEAGTRFFGNLEARYRVSRNVELSAIYSDDFEGQSDLSIGLRGIVTFNPPRRHRLPDEGRGILTGRAFLDRNRDGIRQEDEPGIPGVRIAVRGTRLALNANRDGEFTIQNVKSGLYEVGINKRSLPLGYMVAEASEPRVTIAAGRRTDVDIPVILSGQVRGAVFIDDNSNGETDPGEQRLEGRWVKLIPEDGSDPITIQSASFGQYGFENINPGTYRLDVEVSGRPFSQVVTVSDEDPFQVVPVAVPPDWLDEGGGSDFSIGLSAEP